MGFLVGEGLIWLRFKTCGARAGVMGRFGVDLAKVNAYGAWDGVFGG